MAMWWWLPVLPVGRSSRRRLNRSRGASLGFAELGFEHQVLGQHLLAEFFVGSLVALVDASAGSGIVRVIRFDAVDRLLKELVGGLALGGGHRLWGADRGEAGLGQLVVRLGGLLPGASAQSEQQEGYGGECG